eukprot:jgi/Chlat1/6813/Chrsp51S06561
MWTVPDCVCAFANKMPMRLECQHDSSQQLVGAKAVYEATMFTAQWMRYDCAIRDLELETSGVRHGGHHVCRFLSDTGNG